MTVTSPELPRARFDVAAVYDVHGNLAALDAVLAEIAREGPALVVVGGDLVLGPMPLEVLERLSALRQPVVCLRGNGEREVIAAARLGRPPQDGDERIAAWVANRLGKRACAAIERFEPAVGMQLARLGAVLFCHASPLSDERGFGPDTGPREARRLLAGVTHDVVVCGHTHVQLDRRLDGVRLVNPGSVGLPHEPADGAFWAMLGSEGVNLRRTMYDIETAATAMRKTGYPGEVVLA